LNPFVILAVYFGVAIYAATSSVIVITGEAERPWFWWSALLPLAASHWVAGFLATWPGGRLAALSCGAISGATTVMAIGVAASAAHYVGQWVPRQAAVLILVAASLAGLFGLALATRFARPRR